MRESLLKIYAQFVFSVIGIFAVVVAIYLLMDILLFKMSVESTDIVELNAGVDECVWSEKDFLLRSHSIMFVDLYVYEESSKEKKKYSYSFKKDDSISSVKLMSQFINICNDRGFISVASVDYEDGRLKGLVLSNGGIVIDKEVSLRVMKSGVFFLGFIIVVLVVILYQLIIKLFILRNDLASL